LHSLTPLQNLGFAKSSLGKPDEALEHRSRAIEQDPRDEGPHLCLGMVWFDQRDLTRAQLEFEAAARLNPDRHLAQGYLGLVHMNQGHLQVAEAHLRTALRLNPNDAVALENLKAVMEAEATGKR
jgi:tetratricopeptide (TPR) repeat protein